MSEPYESQIGAIVDRAVALGILSLAELCEWATASLDFETEFINSPEPDRAAVFERWRIQEKAILSVIKERAAAKAKAELEGEA